MQSIAETCVRFDAAHLSIYLVSEIAVPMFPTLNGLNILQLNPQTQYYSNADLILEDVYFRAAYKPINHR